MIFYSLLGHIQNSSKMEKYIQDILNYYFPAGLDSDVDITITINDHLGGYAGFCDGDTEEVNVDIALGEYLLTSTNSYEYQPYSEAEIFRFLAHELVHAKQCILGDMCSYNSTWKNVSMREFSDQPWEQEAYEAERMLFEKFFV